MARDRKGLTAQIAIERVESLFSQAEAVAASDPALSMRYVRLLREIAAHYRVGMPGRMRDRLCRGCGSLMVPGLNASVRLVSSKGFVAYRCSGCGRERHVFYRPRRPRQ
jgi:ribonuclease P protein subunit RPR2